MKIIDLFAGCGGMTAGFVDAGYEPVLSVEWDQQAAATYAANYGADHTFAGDITALDNADIPTADLVIGGPPCQGFSNLGSRDVNDPRNKLWQQYLRVVTHAKPKVFVIENVDRFLSSTEFAALQGSVADGDLKGYSLNYGVLNAADFGVSQRRNRTIVIGSRIGAIPLPTPTHARGGAGGLLPWNTVRDALAGIPMATRDTALPARTWAFDGTNMPGPFTGEDLHLGRTPTPKSLLRYDCIPPGGGRFDLPDELLPDCWRNKPTGTTDVMGRMRWDQPSLTIRTEFFKPEKGQYLHPQWDEHDPTARTNRPITHLEAARIQGFGDDFRWCGTKIGIAKQIGNAVPVGLARAIADHLKPYVAAATERHLVAVPDVA
ncbi:DNA cytosine methyltransferase (plasmid) [Rhodococcus antarcticus]|uniref:Cytosine-specific methyltransferase n=1 Tax=Rhodococcus antarcticus TaxID=2987751 RepID=A0ABY6P757_9NOCA|nr:DNA cytosine methyltransferase [Rhodococcus antarcticus]UZJ26998.1 DNA cytosine methyltransferase [Rhodococcus antarcticus]